MIRQHHNQQQARQRSQNGTRTGLHVVRAEAPYRAPHRAPYRLTKKAPAGTYVAVQSWQ